jgi:hypothetical protein
MEDQTKLSESRFAQFHFGYFLVTPYFFQLTLTALVLVFALLIIAPGVFLMKYALCLSLAATAFQLLLAGGMIIQSISRPASRTIVSRSLRMDVFFMSPVGADIAVISFAVVGGLGCLLFAINLTAALCGCPSRDTTQDLATFIFNTSNASAVTDFNELERRPFFFTELAWSQLCLDDYAMTIAWTVIGYASVLLDIVVIWHEGRLRDRTERLYGSLKKGSGPADPYVELPSVEQGLEGADVLVARLSRRRFETRWE